MNIQYDFAFSFAGEDRVLVEQVKEGLQGYTVFYDNDYQSELCGKDLYKYLRNLYLEKSKYVICFLSRHYRQKIWTNLEFTAIKERLMATFFASDFLIPIVLDEDGFLEDIPSFIGFYKHTSIQETIALLKAKYRNSLNEDYYLDNIKNFRNYLLQKITDSINVDGIQAIFCEGHIRIIENGNETIFFLMPETFSNLPCLLLYEEKMENPPSALITWKRKKNIVFFWELFTSLTVSWKKDITITELIHNMKYYFLYSEG